MKMALKTTYQIKAIPIIRSFIEETAKYYGANKSEYDELKLATEEAAEHIIINYPKEQQGFFEIFCIVENNVFRVVLSNTGVPVDKKNIPKYKVEDPSDSIDGLKFFLIKKLTDNFYFLNLGSEGWQTVLEKKLLARSSNKTDKTESEENSKPKANNREDLVVSLASPEDAYQITKLAYFTYHYSYAKTVFYYPEVLSESLKNKTVISFIAKTSSGEVVIHSSLLRSPYSPGIVEAGALMSNPEFRRNRGLILIIKKQIGFCTKSEHGIKIVESNLVTAHTGSQRVTKASQFFPFALKISVHKRVEFISIESETQRETLLYAIWTPFGLEQITLNTPEIHHTFIKQTFKNAQLQVTLSSNTFIPKREQSKFNIDKKEVDNFAILTIEETGKNWVIEMKKVIRELNAENFITFHLHFPAWKKIPVDFENQLNLLGFFFSGVIPHTPQNWWLNYTRLDNQKFDFDKVLTEGENATQLRDYIRRCHNNAIELSDNQFAKQ